MNRSLLLALSFLTLSIHITHADIHLKSGTISTKQTKTPMTFASPSAQTIDNCSCWIIQFSEAITPENRNQIETGGGTIKGYIPENALLVLATAAQASTLQDLSDVHWVGPYIANYKLSPTLTTQNLTNTNTVQTITISLLRPAYLHPISSWIEQQGGTIEKSSTTHNRATIQASLPSKLLSELASQQEVEWIEPHLEPTWMNNVATEAPRMNLDHIRNTHGLRGKGQIVAVGDSGLDTGDLNTLHPDFTNRLHYAYSYLYSDTDWSDHNGHGTHVCGSVLGNGSAYSNGLYQGAAPEAQLVMLALGDNSGSGSIHLPSPLSALFTRAYTNDARIISNSWGSDANGAYTTEARSVDQFVWDQDDMLIVFAAGNNGQDSNHDGVIDLGSAGSPGTAKNALTVGAAESFRPAGSGGASSLSWGYPWPAAFGADPIKNDLISTSADGLHQGMAAFSSRGPCEDGRIKPDVIAPGTDIISCRSRGEKAGTLWGTGSGELSSEASSLYCFSGGTSMATPLVSGLAAITRQYFAKEHSVTNPTAALLKAALINGAASLYPGQYGTNTTLEIPNTRPNDVEGWGQVNAENMLYPAQKSNFFWDRNRLKTGEQHNFSLQATSTNALRITLAWSDYPATLASAQQLVNDLDLMLITPSGHLQFARNGAADHTNNVEEITLDPAEIGTYQLMVFGYNVPEGPQPYALFCQFNGTADQPFQIISAWHSPHEIIPSSMPIQLSATISPAPSGMAIAVAAYRETGGSWIYQAMDPQGSQGLNELYSTDISIDAPGSTIEYYTYALSYDMKLVTSPTNRFRINSETVLVSPSGTQTWPYGTWETAYTNIQNAINQSPEGSTILITNGTYSAGTLFLDRDVTLTSISGPESVLLDGEGTAPVLQMNKGTISGLTFTNGWAVDGGGIGMNGGVLTNCWIRGNRSSNMGGGIYLISGTMDRCRIEDNYTTLYGGGGLILGGTIQHSLIAHNEAGSDAAGVEVWGGLLRNCTVMYNHSGNYGGGTDIGDEALLENCIVVSNTAVMGGNNWYEWVPMNMSHSCTYPQPPGHANMALDPLLTEDYHLRSTAGRWTPFGWVLDTQNSPCIDMGNPQHSFVQEPSPAGRRINMGAFGNTEQASKSEPNQSKVIVQSAEGAIDPPAGAYLYPNLSTQEFTLTHSMLTQNTTQHLFSAWTIDNGQSSEYLTTGTNHNLTLGMTNNWIVTWNWDTEYWLNATNSGPGTLSGASNGWQEAGTSLFLTASADNYYAFSNWTGSANSSFYVLPLTMDQAHQVQAHFIPLLTANGTPQWWLAQYGLTNDMETASSADQDADQAATWEEYIAGTIPTDPTSVLRLSMNPPSPSSFTTLTWNTQANRTYTLYYSTNLFTPHAHILSRLYTPTPMELTLYDIINTQAPSLFYQLEVDFQPVE